MELCNMNLFHNDKLKSNITTLTPYNICTTMCSKNNLFSGIFSYSFSTVPTHLIILLCVRLWISGYKQIGSCSPPSILIRFRATLLLSLGTEMKYYQDSSKRVGCTCRDSNNALHEMIQTVTWWLGSFSHRDYCEGKKLDRW